MTCPNCNCYQCQSVYQRNPWKKIPLSYGRSVSRFEPSRREKSRFNTVVADVAKFLEEAKDALWRINTEIPSDFVLIVTRNPDGEEISIVSGWRQLGRTEGRSEQRRWAETAQLCVEKKQKYQVTRFLNGAVKLLVKSV